MDLLEFSRGTPQTKGWLNIVAGNIHADTITADSGFVGPVLADSLTLNQQASVPNPAPNQSTIFISPGGALQTTDFNGNTVLYETNPSSADFDLGAFNITNIGTIIPSGDILIGGSITDATPGGNVIIGDTATCSTTGAVVVGGGSDCQGAQGVAIGPGAIAGTGSFNVAVGRATNSSGGAGVAIGNQAVVAAGSGVAIGSVANCSATNSVCVGRAANCQNTSSNAVAVGFGAVCANGGFIAIGNGAIANAAGATVFGGGTNAVANTCLIGGSSILGIYPGSSICNLGTLAVPFQDAYLSGGVHGPLSVGSNYSTYDDTKCDNTVTETNISTTASSVGSLVLPAGQPLGMVFEINTCITASSVAGDNLDLRFYSNGGLLFTHSQVIPALSVDLPIIICTKVTIRNGVIHVCSVANQNATLSFIVSSSIVYDRTIAQTWSVTAQWGANVNQLTCGQLFATSYFRG